MIILISDHSHCHRQGVESWRLPETVGSFSAWTWTTSCRQRRFTFGQSQDDLHKIMMIMIIIKSKPRQILTIMTMAGIFTRCPSRDASSRDWIFSYSSFKARHGECVKQCQMSFFQVGIGLSSSPLGLAAYIMEKVAKFKSNQAIKHRD